MTDKENKEVEQVETKEETKKPSEWDRIKTYLTHNKRYILTLFPTILIAIFLGSMCSSWQKNGYTLYFVLCLVGVVLLLGASSFLVIKAKIKCKKYNVSPNVLISVIFAFLFLSGLILMIFYKVLSMIDTKNILNITGLVSVIVLVVYILSVIGSFYLDIDKLKNIFKRKDKNK